jgi:hypothetical protein
MCQLPDRWPRVRPALDASPAADSNAIHSSVWQTPSLGRLAGQVERGHGLFGTDGQVLKDLN